MENIEVMQELKDIKEELSFIRKQMVDKDMILTRDDFEALEETASEKKQGKLVSIEDIEKELECS